MNWAFFAEPIGVLTLAAFAVMLTGSAVVFLHDRAPSQHRRRVVIVGKSLIWVGFAFAVAALVLIFTGPS